MATSASVLKASSGTVAPASHHRRTAPEENTGTARNVSARRTSLCGMVASAWRRHRHRQHCARTPLPTTTINRCHASILAKTNTPRTMARLVCVNKNQPKCEDTKATNYGGPLPCIYPPPKCEVEGAENYGGPLPCVCPKDHVIQGNKCVYKPPTPPPPPKPPRGPNCDGCIQDNGGWYCGSHKSPEWRSNNPPSTVCYIDDNVEYDHCGQPIPNLFTIKGCTPITWGWLCYEGASGLVEAKYECP